MELFESQNATAQYFNPYEVEKDLYNFYRDKICCDLNGIVNITLKTMDQSNNEEWYEERKVRITASNAHRVKGDRFNAEKVINNFLGMKSIQTTSMAYGKKMEKVALKEYSLHFEDVEIVTVGLIVSINHPWLCCSPDSIAINKNTRDKYLIEIKCPSTCQKKPIIEIEPLQINVSYLENDENGVRLKTSNQIYTQVQLQMYVTNLSFCHLFVYSPVSSVLVILQKDDIFLSELIPRLEKFFFTLYLPKLYYNSQK